MNLDYSRLNEKNDVVHVDEKWFNLSGVTKDYILAAGEQPPNKAVQRKSKNEKVMFLCAVARPCRSNTRNTFFGGKTVSEPLGTRPRRSTVSDGTIEIKNVAVEGKLYNDLIFKKFIRVIEQTWSQCH